MTKRRLIIPSKNGMININNLNNGDYLLEKIKVPKGYQKATVVHIKVVDNIAKAINAPGNIIIDSHKSNVTSSEQSSNRVSLSSKKEATKKNSTVTSSSKKGFANNDGTSAQNNFNKFSNSELKGQDDSSNQSKDKENENKNHKILPQTSEEERQNLTLLSGIILISVKSVVYIKIKH